MNAPLTSDEPVLVTVDEAARRLAVCRRTLEREMAAGRFPAPLRIGRARRVPLTALQEYLTRLTASHAAA